MRRSFETGGVPSWFREVRSGVKDEEGVYESKWYSFSGSEARCQSFDLYNFRNCGITLA